ncbi:MAG TPA: tetratricopeptide repeat protein [Kofleriaceae bacterium]|nr:tetratricopeptide repeat protein [Kofleriaceae bacterium]
MTCPSETMVAQFADAQLAEPSRSELERHIDTCPRCRQLVGALVRDPGREQDARPTPVIPGTVVGRYVIEELVGIGGMGAVYAAHDPNLDRKVAVKLLRENALDSVSRERLVREAKTLAKISHPNVVAVHDVGVADDSVFIAMELVTGGSLATWCRSAKRTSREIVSMYVQAGRGLVAAHRAGIVHRDFKPDNVLVDSDGRPRVSDFGLARAVAESADGGVGLDHALTITNSRASGFAGTPAYMSPEQFEGAVADARSDQFSFCVSLYQALYDQRPFAGDNVAELAASVLGAELRRPRSGDRRVVRAIERGLSHDPGARFASLDELLAELEPRHSAWRYGAPAIALAGVAVMFAVTRTTPESEDCAGADAEIAHAWSASDKAAVASAFAATKLAYAADTSSKISTRLDSYATRWIASHDGACRATRVRHDQSEAAMQLRMNCLGDRQRQLHSLVQVLAAADAKTVESAVRATSELPNPETCDDVSRLQAVAPIDPAHANEITALTAKIAEADALASVGKLPRAVEILTGAVADARKLGHAPTEAKALLELGGVQLEAGDAKTGEANLHDAIRSAERGHADDIRADAAVRLVHAVRVLHPADIDGAIHDAEAVLARAPNGFLDAALALNIGGVALQQGKFDQALASFERARDGFTRERGPNAIELIASLGNIAATYQARGEGTKALEAGRRAATLAETVLGPDHPGTGKNLYSVAGALLELQRPDEALQVASRVKTIYEHSLGEHDSTYANVVFAIALIEAQRKNYDDAVKQATRAIAIYREVDDREGAAGALAALAHMLSIEGHGAEAFNAAREGLAIAERDPSNKPTLAIAVHEVAYQLVKAHKPAEALPVARRAVALYEEIYDPKGPELAECSRTLGMALVDTGHRADAAPLLKRALAQAGGDNQAEVRADATAYLAR